MGPVLPGLIEAIGK